MTARVELFDRLCGSGVALHGWNDEFQTNVQLEAAALRYVLDHVSPGDRTLETGVGYSTVVFAIAGARHTAVAPLPAEHERVRTWCAAEQISTDDIEFVLDVSQRALPTMAGDLDFVLVDGGHLFPVPFVDWYYAAERLRLGGRLMIDDIQLRSVEVLVDFLRADHERWREVATFERTVVFEKVAAPVLPIDGWVGQPWMVGRRPTLPRRIVDAARAKVRLRSRLRRLAGRRRQTGG
jgi:predicted O-methyltransferase YrrM